MNLFRNIMLGAAMTLTAAPAVWAGGQEEPALTIRTNIYEEFGPQNVFTLLLSSTTKQYFDIDMGFGAQEIEVVPATVVDGAWKGTFIECVVSSKGEIKVYGDASAIDVVMATGASITDIDLSKCANLDVLSLEHNELQGIDLTPNKNLSAIYLTDNPGTAEHPIIIGGPKNNLQILEVDIIDYLDPNFSLTQYPALQVFDAYHTLCLDKVDLSNCPNLISLSLEMTAVSSVDFSHSTRLNHVNVSETRLTSVDVSMLPYLQRLLTGHTSGTINTGYKLQSLDVTHNPLLYYLAAQGNNLTQLDVTKNPELQNFYVQNNNLTTLDLTKNTGLASVNISNNRFTYSTLPENMSTWTEYFYEQKPYELNKCYAKGTTLNFPEMLREGSTTYARVMRKPIGADPEAVPEEDYTFSSETGALTLNAVYTDSVYVDFANTAFPDYDLTTTPFMVKEASEIGQPSQVLRLGLYSRSGDVTFGVGLDGASAASPRKILIDLGDGTQKEYTVTSQDASTTITATPAGRNLVFYTPEGEVLTALTFKDRRLLTADLSKATELRWLDLSGCLLANISLENNRCLQSLNLDNNSLAALELKGVRGDYEKNALTKISAASNRLKSFNIINTSGCRDLNLSGNLLTEFSLKDYDNMEHLDLSGNQLQSVNLAYMGNARSIDLSDNKLTEVEGISEMPYCETFDLSDNSLTLATLPYFTVNAPQSYLYAPQARLTIPAKAPGVNLSQQNRVIDGTGTTYVWKTAEGAVLKAGTDYRITDDGATRFLNTSLGKVFCEMTNPAFPALQGADAFRTTEVTPMGAPTTVVASFTTPEAVDNGSISLATTGVDALYIDWRGDDTDFVPYPTKETYTIYDSIPTYAGAHVKVYTYNSPSDVTVFSIAGVPMSEFNGSPMNSLINFSLSDAGLDPDKLTFPDKTTIRELTLDGNNFADIDLSAFPALTNVSVSNNKLTTLDLSKAPKLQTAAFGYNQISSATFNNPSLWGLDLTSNAFESITLTGLPAIEQIGLYHNKLSTIDIEPVKSTLRGLLLSDNCFTFATLPVPDDYPQLTVYHYGRQAQLDVEMKDMKVDLSSQAKVSDTATEFHWYLDAFDYDPDNGTVTGEELIAGEEYTISDGVTTFLATYSKPVQGLLTNGLFPNLYLYTGLLYFSTAIEAVEADGGDTNLPVTVYNLQGVAVRTNVLPADALEGLSPGIYIVAGKKVLVN